ncbi:hypothetical protein CDD82_3154 [Ophiocordyceps australis]|uniref:Cytochrome P450 n=1 Tax=Ophiocordyceps australis TaxID=1399860 RepID=A0A2C5ZEU2_9HYPO|nr:hypothetical protein CDD82_3154 [Ophiocordyceps australis]
MTLLWAVALLTYRLAVCIYRIWLHPLAKVPGPPLLAASYLPYLWHDSIRGKWNPRIAKLHAQYGPIVRIGPNHLAIEPSLAWTYVFANRPGKPEYPKHAAFYGPEGRYSLIGAPTTQAHRSLRKLLARGFNDAAIMSQESVIANQVDLLMARLSEHASRSQPVNMVEWFRFTTFDITGALTFGYSFGCLESQKYHPLAEVAFEAIRQNSWRRVLTAYTTFDIPDWLMSNLPIFSHFRSVFNGAKLRAKERISLGEFGRYGRPDFFTHLLQEPQPGDPPITEKQLYSNSFLLVMAGSDTTATTLSGLIFHISQNPETYKLLRDEIESEFAAESDVTFRRCASLNFLNACIWETLRLYPPVPDIPPRVSPGDVIDGYPIPEGTSISVYLFPPFRNSSNFVDADMFCPQRWLPSHHALYDSRFSKDNLSLVKPFSHGPRDCLGQNLAFNEVRLVISRMFLRFYFEALPGQQGWLENQRMFIVFEKSPLYIRLRQR